MAEFHPLLSLSSHNQEHAILMKTNEKLENEHQVEKRMARNMQTIVQSFIIIIATQEFEVMKDHSKSGSMTLLFFFLTAILWKIDVWLERHQQRGTPFVVAVHYLQLLVLLCSTFTATLFLKMLLSLLLFDASTGLIVSSQVIAPIIALFLLSSVIVFLQYFMDPSILRQEATNGKTG